MKAPRIHWLNIFLAVSAICFAVLYIIVAVSCVESVPVTEYLPDWRPLP